MRLIQSIWTWIAMVFSWLQTAYVVDRISIGDILIGFFVVDLVVCFLVKLMTNKDDD